MRIQQQPGFVLHQSPYSETSLVLEVFTPEHGRVGVLAKGARRPGNSSRAFLKPFQPLLLGWSGRG
ncbi:MAG: recombination protein O N-terminal domain-containing protein, partial [Gammaproteobacteria bacterium]|nr:recombination protein O N-terminal domain-containing protein [Gammaproteobacteria bacterium]